MKIQQSKLKINGIKSLGLFLSFFTLSNVALSGTPVFSIVLIERPLTIYSLPLQKATANSNFNFNFTRFISKIQPEVDYKVTNNAKRTLTDIELIDLPGGVTRIYEGEGVCAARFTLNPNQSCILRFYVNKTKYTRSLKGAPIVCYHPLFGFCYQPSKGKQIDDVVSGLPGPTKIQITPEPNDGLHFNPNTLTISGKPNKAREYSFSIKATNGSATAAPRSLQIKVNINPKDKPIFKANYSLASAMPEQEYRVNLMDLIEPKKSFMVSNQVTFRIDTTHSHPDWLSIDSNNTTLIKGHVPSTEAGQIKEITLIATSNTGGDSLPLTLKIPVAFDPTKKPIIDKNIVLTAAAGEAIHNDFRPNITDPAADGNIKLIIDKIEPQAPWLSVSPTNPTELNGVVPESAVGQTYFITLYANTAIGGSSYKEIIPLNITINKNKTPRFYQDNPNLPLLYVGQPFSYDFVANNDVDPEYSDIPYVVALAEGAKNPDWVKIKQNKLIVDRVPEDSEQVEYVFITIKNTPGGKSKILTLKLYIMN